MVKQEKYLTPEVEEIELSIEFPIASSIVLYTMIGTDFSEDPVVLTDDQMTTIF